MLCIGPVRIVLATNDQLYVNGKLFYQQKANSLNNDNHRGFKAPTDYSEYD